MMVAFVDVGIESVAIVSSTVFFFLTVSTSCKRSEKVTSWMQHQHFSMRHAEALPTRHIFGVPCPEIVCWKNKMLGSIIKMFSETEVHPIHTGMFHKCLREGCASNLVLFDCFRNLNSSWPKNGEIVVIEQADICCAKERLLQARHTLRKLVLITVGHDNLGSPATQHSSRRGDQFSCLKELLGTTFVEKYFVSQHKSSYQHPKLEYIPIGLGSASSRLKARINANTLMSTLEEVRTVLNAACLDKKCVMTPIAVNTNLDGKVSGKHRQMAYAELCKRFVNVTNYYGKLKGKGIFQHYGMHVLGFSPKGTHYDCWRHYEVLISGSIPIVDQHHSIYTILSDLPTLVLNDWSTLTNSSIHKHLKNMLVSGGFNLQKLGDCYWLRRVGVKLLGTKCGRRQLPRVLQ
eukprot:scaffold2656_cov365-Pavlova_lutheri.AAC.9